jgi:hypothetical protein
MCVLCVTGTQFDVDLYVARSGLTALKVFRAGEPRSALRPEGKRVEVSGFTVNVSRHPFDDLPGQVTDAIAFLNEHGKALATLRSAPGVEDMRLDFPVDLRIDRRKIMAQFDSFPPDLVSLAGAIGLGLELSIYPPDLESLAEGRRRDRPSRQNASEESTD